MKLISLTRGMFAKVDDDDYVFISSFKWTAHYHTGSRNTYAERCVKRKTKSMHRVIMNCPEGLFVDHKNHDTLDNRKGNLRICTKNQNNANRMSSKSGTSKYLGVHYRKDNNKWRAAIRINNQSIRLGHFLNQEDAALAYNEAAIKYHGEFANLNKIIC